jgi:type II secretory pathway component PulC
VGPCTSSRSLRRWASVGLIVLGTSCGVQAQEGVPVTGGEPPFWVAGVVIGAEKRSAILVMLDSGRRDVGHMTLREGESISGYRVAGVEPDRVLLERGGSVFSVPVGQPKTGPTGALGVAGRRPVFIPGPDKPTPDLEFKKDETRRRQRGGSSGVPAGADRPDPQAIRDPEAAQDILQRVFGNPRLQQRLDESRPIIRQRLEREREERSQGVPADAAPAGD